MAEKIGADHGFEATRVREGQLHPAYATAWDKRSSALKKMAANQNELIDRVAALEAAPPAPFPFPGSST